MIKKTIENSMILKNDENHHKGLSKNKKTILERT